MLTIIWRWKTKTSIYRNHKQNGVICDMKRWIWCLYLTPLASKHHHIIWLNANLHMLYLLWNMLSFVWLYFVVVSLEVSVDTSVLCSHVFQGWFTGTGAIIWLSQCKCILPKGPYPPCLRMADRALLAGYPQSMVVLKDMDKTGGRFKNTYELLNLRALKISKLHKNHIFQCMGKIFCVEFQRVPLKFHTKYLTHTLKDVDFIHIWKFKSS